MRALLERGAGGTGAGGGDCRCRCRCRCRLILRLWRCRVLACILDHVLVGAPLSSLWPQMDLRWTPFLPLPQMDMLLEMELGITGGEEDGVDNENANPEDLYTKPEEVRRQHATRARHGAQLAGHCGNGHRGARCTLRAGLKHTAAPL